MSLGKETPSGLMILDLLLSSSSFHPLAAAAKKTFSPTTKRCFCDLRKSASIASNSDLTPILRGQSVFSFRPPVDSLQVQRPPRRKWEQKRWKEEVEERGGGETMKCSVLRQAGFIARICLAESLEEEVWRGDRTSVTDNVSPLTCWNWSRCASGSRNTN